MFVRYMNGIHVRATCMVKSEDSEPRLNIHAQSFFRDLHRQNHYSKLKKIINMCGQDEGHDK